MSCSLQSLMMGDFVGLLRREFINKGDTRSLLGCC